MAATRDGTSTTATASGIWITGSQGASITAADSITITDSVHEITGSTTVNTINGGQSNMGLILLKKAGATWTLGSAGNIKATTGTPPTDRTVQLWTPDGTTWYSVGNSVSVAAGSNKVSVTESSGTYTVDVTEANLTVSNMGGTLAIGHGGTGQTAQTAAFNALSPTTTRGDIIYQGSTGDDVRLAVGAAGTVLIGGTDPSYSANPTVTSLGLADANNGWVSIGTNNPGLKINSANTLSFTASEIQPVTNQAVALGDSTHMFTSVWHTEDAGYYQKTAAGVGPTNAFTFTLANSLDAIGFLVDVAGYGTNGTEVEVDAVTYAIGAVRKSTTVTAGVSKYNTSLSVASLGAATLTATTSVASQTVTVAFTLTSSGFTPNSVAYRYRIIRLYETNPITFTIL